MKLWRVVCVLGLLPTIACQQNSGSSDCCSASDASGASDAGGVDAGASDAAGGNPDAGNANSDGSVGPDAGASTAEGTIVPLYTYPTDSTWSTVRQSAANHPGASVVAIINPFNGPGTTYDPAYASGINTLEAAGARVIGYVHTSWGGRPATTVQADILSYKTWYPQLQGIFFDEMAAATGSESYYLGLSSYAKSSGFTFTVGNPGTQPAASYVGTMDTLVIYENSGLPTIASLQSWSAGFPGVSKSDWCVIAYGLSTLDTTWLAQAIPYAGWIYVDTDNSYQDLPPYFDTLVGDL